MLMPYIITFQAPKLNWENTTENFGATNKWKDIRIILIIVTRCASVWLTDNRWGHNVVAEFVTDVLTTY